MIDWLLIFLGGMLGSSHCIGMCGAFAVTLGSGSASVLGNLCRQAIYSLGRVFTYSMAGAAAGYGGWRLVKEADTLVNVQAVLSLAAGVVLVYLGLLSAGVVPGKRHMGGQSCLAPGLFAGLLRASRWRSVFLGGVINGLLPCGLVYGYLALAASSGTMLSGWATMALFGLGTVPAMVLVGAGGRLLGLAARKRLLLIAAWCVVLTGALAIGRGVVFLRSPGAMEAGCPYCADETSP